MSDGTDACGQAILGLSYVCGTPEPHDGRLKVFWLEDELVIDIEEDLKRFVQVTQALAPESAEAILRASRRDALQNRGDAGYNLPHCPHDIYIADFRLRQAAKNKLGGNLSPAANAEAAGLTTAVLMASSFPEHPATIIPYTAFIAELQAQLDLVRRLSPEFLNVNWDGELGKAINVDATLRRAVCEHREHLVVAAARNYIHLRDLERTRLIAELQAGAAGKGEVPWNLRIDIGTRWGLRSLLLFSLWPELKIRPGVPVTSGQLLRVVPRYRPVKPTRDCDESEAGQPAYEQVVEWLRRFPVPTEVERNAAELAYTFFCQRHSIRSWQRYELSAWLRSGTGPNDNPHVAVLCAAIGLDIPAVQALACGLKQADETGRELDSARERTNALKKRRDTASEVGNPRLDSTQLTAEVAAAKKELADLHEKLDQERKANRKRDKELAVPEQWVCSHLLSTELKRIADGDILRLAVLFLLVYEAALRWRHSEELAEGLSKKGSQGVPLWLEQSTYPPASTVAGFVAKVRQQAEAAWAKAGQAGPVEPEFRGELLAKLLGVDAASEFLSALDPDGQIQWRAMMPISAADVARLVDPLPAQLLTADFDFTAGRVNVALGRKPLLLNVTDILSGRGNGGATDAEWRGAGRFALELGFPQEAWPTWLRRRAAG